MFFPTSAALPTLGDRVCHRPYSAALTVALTAADEWGCLWVHFECGAAAVRVEALNWYPAVGARVEVLFPAYLGWLDAKRREFTLGFFSGDGKRDEWQGKLDRLRLRMRTGLQYRVGELAVIDRDLCQVQFSGERSEVMPLCCVAVVTREKP